MKWFRSHIKQGSRLALFALAVQFALSFGHFHAVTAQEASSAQSGPTQPDILRAVPVASDSARQPSPTHHDSGRHPDDACAICAVMALANAALFSTPPVLLLPEVVEFLYRATDTEFVHLKTAGSAFQPRAPPVS